MPIVMESKVQHRAEPGWMRTLEGLPVGRGSLLGASLTDLPSLTLSSCRVANGQRIVRKAIVMTTPAYTALGFPLKQDTLSGQL